MIAPRFLAGWKGDRNNAVPEGRLNSMNVMNRLAQSSAGKPWLNSVQLSRPYGTTNSMPTVSPAMNRWAIIGPSLREVRRHVW